MELDPVDRLNPESQSPTCDGSATRLREWRSRVPTLACFSIPKLLVRAAAFRAVLLGTLSGTALALGLATWGVATNRNGVAMVGLAATAVTAAAMAVSARASIRTRDRSFELLDRALAESERARDDLRVENATLQRRNADLRTLELAVEEGFDWIDERTQGRLRELVEEAGDELAALVDEVLDSPTEGAA